jgi:L-rhamnose mutarotase
MNAFAISLYDKFDQLGVLVDIIRNNWNDDYHISVCSNHEKAKEKISKLDLEIDNFEQGSQITWPTDGEKGDNNLTYRIYDSLRRACRSALTNEKVENVIHLHADAWPLSEDGLFRILKEMDKNNAAVGFPARTKDFVKNHPPGYIYDQFIIFNADTSREVNLFDHSPLELFPQSIHQALAMHCVSRFGWSQIHQYTNCTERQHWDGLKLTEVRNHARPMFYDPEYGQIHIAVEDFDNNLGEELQAHYLKEYNLTEGRFIEEYINSHARPKKELFDQLSLYLDSLDRYLRPYGVSVDKFGREMRLIRDFRQETFREKIKYSVYLNTENTRLFPLVEGVYATIQNDTKDLGEISMGEEIAEKKIHEAYKNQLNEEHFPPSLSDEFESVFRVVDHD